MYDALDRLLAFIKPAAEQWDEHQSRLEYTTTQLVNMMQEYRRPYDLQNEVKTYFPLHIFKSVYYIFSIEKISKIRFDIR